MQWIKENSKKLKEEKELKGLVEHIKYTCTYIHNESPVGRILEKENQCMKKL